MYCINCGATVEENSIFCTNCGRRIKSDPVVTVAEQESQIAETSAPVSDEPVTAVPAFETSASETVPPVSSTYSASWSAPVIQPVIPEKEAPEKVFFGKGALTFCLVIIGLLAISTGVFAGLYFSLL